MLTPSEIKTFIDFDNGSDKKKLALVGQRYYEGLHDIKGYRIFFVNADGKLEEDKTKNNIRLSHPFFTENVDQTVQYMLSGKDGFVKSDDPALQAKLDEYFNDNEDFKVELEELLTDVGVKGFAYMYAFINADGRTTFECADSIGVVECRAKTTSDHCEYIIRWYVERINTEGQAIKRIEVWDDKQVQYFSQIDDGEVTIDEDEKINPRPHTILTKGKDGKKYCSDYGMIPFFRLDSCKKQLSWLNPIKDLIDDYDLLNSDLSNNIQDTNEALYVVKGFEGDNLDELMMNIKAKKHIGVGEDGDVEVKTVDIPVEARKEKLEIDEKNIYRFGFGLNTAGLKDTAATTNIAIKSAYSLLDLRANKLTGRVKQFMRKLLDVILAEINKADGTDWQQKDVYFSFDREVPTNALENAQIELTEAQKRQTEITTILNLATALDNETQMQLICEQLDIDYEEIKDKLPKPEDSDPYAAKTALDAVVPETDPAPETDGGDVIE